MTREELLAVAKPILFNSDMVRAILAGNKTQTRRIIRSGNGSRMVYPPSSALLCWESDNGEKVLTWNHREPIGTDGLSRVFKDTFAPRYDVGTILYVREGWAKIKGGSGNSPDEYGYKADRTWSVPRWNPGLHMPKSAARIFLRVTNVRAERLQDISDEEACAEGAPLCFCDAPRACDWCARLKGFRKSFAEIWDGTIKQKNRDTFGWRANPWVWVYTFERVMPDEEETS